MFFFDTCKNTLCVFTKYVGIHYVFLLIFVYIFTLVGTIVADILAFSL
jgi:hypothetical protein